MKKEVVRVAHVSTETSPYGVGRFLEDLSVQQASSGMVEPVFVLNQPGPRIEDVQENGIEVIVTRSNSARDVRLLFELIRLFRHCDIVNVHTHSPFAVLAAALTRKPLIFTFHGAVGIRSNLKGRLLKSTIAFVSFPCVSESLLHQRWRLKCSPMVSALLLPSHRR